MGHARNMTRMELGERQLGESPVRPLRVIVAASVHLVPLGCVAFAIQWLGHEPSAQADVAFFAVINPCRRVPRQMLGKGENAPSALWRAFEAVNGTGCMRVSCEPAGGDGGGGRRPADTCCCRRALPHRLPIRACRAQGVVQCSAGSLSTGPGADCRDVVISAAARLLVFPCK